MNFLVRWLTGAREKHYDKLAELVIEQEFLSKKSRARLKKPRLQPEQFENWIGMGAQNYRIRQAQILIHDIEVGLGNA